MTATRETIETETGHLAENEPRLVDPEPENAAETPILNEIERQFCRFDNAQHAFVSNFGGWQYRNDIGKDDLYADLGTIIAAAQTMRANIARLKERRIREPEEVRLEACAESLRELAGEMSAGLDCRALPGQIERLEDELRSLRADLRLYL